MPKVTIYTTGLCPYCQMAKKLLKKKDVEIDEIDVTFNPKKRAEMTTKAGRHTVPQIWVGETHVGGCDELYALERSGELDELLKGAAA